MAKNKKRKKKGERRTWQEALLDKKREIQEQTSPPPLGCGEASSLPWPALLLPGIILLIFGLGFYRMYKIIRSACR
jgi:hypothetical protein